MKDIDDISTLMNIVEACARHGTAFTNIQSLAMLELKEANREAESEVLRRQEQIRQREAKERAESERRDRRGDGARPNDPPPSNPPGTTDRAPNDPILQRPDPARSIPNEGPNVQSSPQGRQDPPYQRDVATQHTRDVALGDRHYDRRTDHPSAPVVPGHPDRRVPDGAASGDQGGPVPEVDRRV